MSHQEPMSILIAVKPGLQRNALQNLLSTMHDFDLISLVGDLAAALAAVENQRPAVVLIDVTLLHVAPDSAEKLVEAARRHGGHCMVITQNVRQKEMIEEIGVVKAVVQGIHPQALLQAIEELITAGGQSDRFRNSKTLSEQPSLPKLVSRQC